MERPARRCHPHAGCQLSWFTVGEGPPVLMVQGTGVGAMGWWPQIEGLAADHACLAWDNRGYGESLPASRELTVEQMAADALALMDAAGWKSAHVMGHSLGGLIAQYIAHEAPDRVRSLALLCTFATGAIPTRMDPKLLWIGLRTRLGTARMRRHAFLEMVMPPDALATGDKDALAQRLGDLFGRDLADSPAVIMQQFFAMKRGDATPWLAGVRVPTLVVSGAHDPIAPPYAGKALAEGISGSRYVEFADGSHGLVVQHAERVNTLLREHIAAAEKAYSGL
jgi:pimeloyl-ACP methyl ester carboxylesterase